LVIAPLPNARAKPTTVGEWHRRAQWSTFLERIIFLVGALGRCQEGNRIRGLILFDGLKFMGNGIQGLVPRHALPAAGNFFHGAFQPIRMMYNIQGRVSLGA
jgi:hypothetical protein